MNRSAWLKGSCARVGVLFVGCLALLSLSAAGLARQTAGQGRDTGELSCTGAVKYQIGSAPWLTQQGGSAPVVLPIRLESGEASCRIMLTGAGLFEAPAQSRISLARGADRQLQLSIEKGSVSYALADGVKLKVLLPLEGVGATLGAAKIDAKPAMWTEDALSACVGEATLESDKSFHVYSLNGSASIEQQGKPARTVAAGHALRVSVAPESSGQAVSGTGVKPALTFVDQTVPTASRKTSGGPNDHAPCPFGDPHQNQNGRGHLWHHGHGYGHHYPTSASRSCPGDTDDDDDECHGGGDDHGKDKNDNDNPDDKDKKNDNNGKDKK